MVVGLLPTANDSRKNINEISRLPRKISNSIPIWPGAQVTHLKVGLEIADAGSIP